MSDGLSGIGGISAIRAKSISGPSTESEESALLGNSPVEMGDVLDCEMSASVVTKELPPHCAGDCSRAAATLASSPGAVESAQLSTRALAVTLWPFRAREYLITSHQPPGYGTCKGQTNLPLRDSISSQGFCRTLQCQQGCDSATSHLTRLALQDLQAILALRACFASRGDGDWVPALAIVCVNSNG